MNTTITLRPLRATDVDTFMTWAGDPLVTQSLFWDHYTDRNVARHFLETVAQPHPWFMAICRHGTPVGAITLDRGTGKAAHRAELGYVVARAHWGHGYATQAVRIALACGFSDLSVTRIEALVDPDNRGSQRVLERADMSCEGVLHAYVTHRGHIRDRLLYAQWRIA